MVSSNFRSKMSFLHITGAVVNTHNAWLPAHFYWRVGKVAYQCKGRMLGVFTSAYLLVATSATWFIKSETMIFAAKHAPAHAPSPSLKDISKLLSCCNLPSFFMNPDSEAFLPSYMMCVSPLHLLSPSLTSQFLTHQMRGGIGEFKNCQFRIPLLVAQF